MSPKSATYVSLDIAAAESVELFLELERLDMLRDVADKKTHLFSMCFVLWVY